jgi:hypothetical protein
MYLSLSLLIAGLPDKKHVNRDQSDDDQHPALAFESQKGEMLNEKMHHARPNFTGAWVVRGKNILFYIPLIGRAASGWGLDSSIRRQRCLKRYRRCATG